MTDIHEPNGLSFDDDDDAVGDLDDGFSYETAEVPPTTLGEAEPAKYDDEALGIAAPVPMPEPESKSPWALIFGVASGLLLLTLIIGSVFVFTANNDDEVALVPETTTPSVVVPQTTTVTKTQKVPDTAGVKRVQAQLDSMTRDRDRYRGQVASLSRQLAAAKNDATVAKKDASAAKTSRDSARDRANTLDSQLTTVKSDLKEANEQIKKLEAEIEELKTPEAP